MVDEEPIPGETPLDDLSGLRVQGITTKAALNAVEAENIRKAIVKYLASRPTSRAAPFDVAWMLRLHQEMFGDVWTWAGNRRTHETNIGSLPRNIEVELHELRADLAAWQESSMPLLEQAVRLHHRAVRIHPFANGNGRWARMLANIWLMRHGAEPVEWPESTIGTSSVVRGEYLTAVKLADTGDYSRLLALHERFWRPSASKG
ncbi:MAG: mobile mystery protein B [Phycisphaeraceae bacterium]|nr:mobile mystery protein B [Phycisphaeraceae bacterium]